MSLSVRLAILLVVLAAFVHVDVESAATAHGCSTIHAENALQRFATCQFRGEKAPEVIKVPEGREVKATPAIAKDDDGIKPLAKTCSARITAKAPAEAMMKDTCPVDIGESAEVARPRLFGRGQRSVQQRSSHQSPAPHQHSDCRHQPTLFAPRTAHTQVVFERR